MFLNDLCLKISLWPLLAYLANIKGFCPDYATTQTTATITTLSTSSTQTSSTLTNQSANTQTSSLAVSTTAEPSTELDFNNTGFTTIQSTTTALSPCPAYPLMCLTDGKSPISYCPCIDPRQQKNRFKQHPDIMIFSSLDNAKFARTRTTRRARVKAQSQTCTVSDWHLSKCTPIAECSALIEEFYNELKKSSQEMDFNTFIGQRICDFDGKQFLICCSTRLNQNAVDTKPVQFQSLPEFESPVTAPGSQSNFLHALGPSRKPHLPSILQFAPLSGNDDRNNGSPIPPLSAANNVLTESIRFQPLKMIESDTLPTITPPFLEQGITEFKDTCGISRGLINRVVGGAVAKQGTYPWVAALGYRDGGGEVLRFFCAGSLITLKYIVTSAHCINQNLTIARLGAHDLMKVFESTARDYRIKTTKIHDNFDLVTVANDVAVIELTAEADLSDFISTICLPESNHFLTNNFVGLHPFLAGWGANKHQGKTSSVLTDVQVSIVSRERCRQQYKSKFNFLEFTEKLLCAGSVNADACQGDSGSPLMLPQLVGATYRYFLLGMVSYGYECARPNFPGVYTRITSYLDWIKNNTDYN